jgi:hypothetical protein
MLPPFDYSYEARKLQVLNDKLAEYTKSKAKQNGMLKKDKKRLKDEARMFYTRKIESYGREIKNQENMMYYKGN